MPRHQVQGGPDTEDGQDDGQPGHGQSPAPWRKPGERESSRHSRPRRCRLRRRPQHPQGRGRGGRGRPVRRLPSRHRSEQPPPVGRQHRRRHGGTVQPRQGGLDAAPVVLPSTGQALQQDQPQAVDVCRRPHRGADDLLRRQVGGSAQGQPGRGDSGGVDHPGDAEVGQLGAAGPVEQYVARFDVAVHDAAAVHVSQRIGDRPADGSGLTFGQRPAAQPVGQACALDQLHHEVTAALVLPGVVERD